MTSPQKILYFEDDMGSQRLVKRILESYQYEVLIADEGLKGIRMAQADHPHLVLMDINLPGMNGREITTRLRSIAGFQDIPIIAITANSGPYARERALAAGCNGFITKPIDVVRFPKEIESYLAGRIDYLPDQDRLEFLEQHAQEIVSRLEEKIHELQAANQNLRELDRIKSNFIALVSHELRTPLTLVEGYTHLLVDHYYQVNKDFELNDVHDLVSGLENGVLRISTVINDIISISRIASGTFELALTPVTVRYIIDMVMHDIERMIQNRDLDLLVGNLNELPEVNADSIQLRVAIKNIVENAVKYTPDGGQIRIDGRLIDPDTIDLTIIDTGIGIPPEEVRRVFDQFHILGAIEYHTSDKSTFRGGGLGLGLPIAKGIIEAHNGRIWVESGDNHSTQLPGSCFHILLPLNPTKDA